MASMIRSRAWRALAAAVVACALPILLQAPMCASPSCPMAAKGRAGCVARMGMAMGLDCCQGASGRLSPSPAAAPLPDLLAGAVSVALAAPAAGALRAPAPATQLAVPAVVQSVGLHTLFAVFLI